MALVAAFSNGTMPTGFSKRTTANLPLTATGRVPIGPTTSFSNARPLSTRLSSATTLLPESSYVSCSLPPEYCDLPDICLSTCWQDTPMCPGTDLCTTPQCEDPGRQECPGPCSNPCDSADCDIPACNIPQDDCQECTSQPGPSTKPEMMAIPESISVSNQFPPFTDFNMAQSLMPPFSHITWPLPESVSMARNQIMHAQFPTGPLAFPLAAQNATPFQPPLSHPQSSDRLLQPNQTAASQPIYCLWGACRRTFENHNQLVIHVNREHLDLPNFAMPPPVALNQSVDMPLTCHWQNCDMSLDPRMQASSSHQPPISPRSLLASHLLQDHLGISWPVDADTLLSAIAGNTWSVDTATDGSQVAESTSTLLHDLESSSGKPAMLRTGPSSTAVLSPPELPVGLLSPSGVPTTPTAESGSISTYICHWDDCEEMFEHVDALSKHIEDAHVGGGKSVYHCRWTGCDRHGARAFLSKQKILRHLQSHTGHRPFVCSICGQHFSEAATLQQHQRRHTAEKPYKCDHPGCGKTFAVAGALTIHKRIHTGQKPFKCQFCDRAFAESSNLSKHLRTHTGVKPYACPEPGCGKKFCRPDQLTRHRLVHSKKGTKDVPAGVADEDSDGE